MHQIRLALFKAQGQSGEAVGDEVDPQQVHGLQDNKAHERGKEHAQHLAHIGAQQELDGLADVVVNAAPFLHGVDDCGEVVVGQHHIGHVLCNVRAGDAHADADIRALDAGRVVDAVARHGCDKAVFAPCVDDAHLVLGLHAGIHAVTADHFRKPVVGDVVQLRACDGFIRCFDDAELLGDGNGGILVVACDHDGTDAGLAALCNGVLYLGSDRVDHARQAQEGQVMLQRVRLEIRRKLGPFAAGRAQHAQRFVGHLLVLAQDLGAGFLRHGQYLTILGVRGTAAEHHVGRALCVLDICAVVFVHGAHHFAAAVKRSLAHTGLGRLQRALGQADAGGVIYQRAFGGLALSVAVFAGLGVAAQRHRAGQGLFFTHVLHNRHLVLRQRTGLVRADDLCAAQRLHSRKAADDGIALGHVRYADGEYDGNDGGKALGDGRDGKTDRYHERTDDDVEVEIARLDKAEGEDEYADAEHQPAQDLTELRQLFLQRSLSLFGLRQRACDLAHLGVHTGARDEDTSAAVYYGAAHIGHVFAVAQGDVLAVVEAQCGNDFVHGYAFARERGFLDLQAGALQNAAVCGHGVAGFQNDNVARHQLLAFQRDLFAAADHLTGGGRHFLQRLNGFFRLALLIHAEHGVDEHDDKDDEHIRKTFARISRRYTGHCRRNKQDNDHRVAQLLQKALQRCDLFSFGQLVGAFFGQPPGGFCVGKAVRGALQFGKRPAGLLTIKLQHTTSFLVSRVSQFGVSMKKQQAVFHPRNMRRAPGMGEQRKKATHNTRPRQNAGAACGAYPCPSRGLDKKKDPRAAWRHT